MLDVEDESAAERHVGAFRIAVLVGRRVPTVLWCSAHVKARGSAGTPVPFFPFRLTQARVAAAGSRGETVPAVTVQVADVVHEPLVTDARAQELFPRLTRQNGEAVDDRRRFDR